VIATTPNVSVNRGERKKSRLEGVYKPSREGVERLGVEEEVGHAQKRYGNEQSINPVLDG
jgi:hypothetical protein